MYIVCVVKLYTKEVKTVNNKVLNMRLPEKLYEELKKVAEEKNISLASLIRLICTEYLNNQK